MDVNESTFLKKFVNSEGEPAPDTKNAAEQIRARAQMRDFAQKLRRVPLFLERIGIIRSADDVDPVRDQLPFLSFTLRCHQRAADLNRSAGNQPLNIGVVR